MLGKDTGSGITNVVSQAHAFTPGRSVWSWSGVLPIPFWFSVGDDLVRRRFNRAWQELTRHENYVNEHSWMEYVHPDDEPKLRDLYQTAGDEPREFQTEYRLRDGNGAYRWLLEAGRPVHGPDGFICFAGTCFDITERKEVERTLRLNEARFRTVYESHAVPLCYWHADGRIIDANDAYLQLTGFTRAELHAGLLHWDQLTTLKSLQRDRQVLQELRAGRTSAAFEMEYNLRDSRHLWVLVGASLTP